MTDKRPLSILQVCSAREAIYGAVQSLLTLTKAQREAGHRVEFIAFSGMKFADEVRELGYTVYEVPVRFKVDPGAVVQMRSIIRKGEFDIVHTHLSTSSVNGCLAARAANIPSVATVHGMSGKLSFAAANHLIAVSNGVKSHLVNQGVSAEKISVVYNGLEIPSKMPTRTVSGIALGTVSRVTPQKGIVDAIQAVAVLKTDFPDLKYRIVGDGDSLDQCKSLVRELGLTDTVEFVGYQKDVWTELAKMNLFLFPSHKEAMGIALLEAMASGLPAVTTNVGGIPEVVSQDTAVMVDAKKPDELAKAIKDLLLNPDHLQIMGKKASERAKDIFSSSAMQQGTERIYRQLIN